MDPEERLRSALADRYRLDRKIGSGGMATVYRAEDLKHHRQVAVKVLDPELARTLGAERFLREIETVANLTHPHILPLHDSGEAEGFLFFVMPYVKGESLGARLDRETQLPVHEAIRIAREIADALAYSHREGVVHRDVKPANIMLEEGHAVLADFGVAHAVAEARDDRLTRVGASLGTPTYMSPEQAAGEPDLDGRSDQYALGCVLYEMLVGAPPFGGSTLQAVLAGHMAGTVPSIEGLRPAVPRSVVAAIEKALEKSPAHRFPSMEAFSEALVVGGGEEEKKSVAVLPFANMSADGENDYFSDGLAEEIINALSKLEGLFVTARTSAFQFRGKELDIREIGRKLNVGTVLEGSVRKAGKRIRVTAQLINVADGYHLWSERFDRSMKDVFAVQDEIAMAVVEKLRVELFEGEEEKVTKRHTENEEAYGLYLRGRYYWNQRYPRAMVKAVECFHKAVAKDPRYALAYVGIADVFNMLGEFGFVPPQDAYTLSRSLLQKAREIDDSLSDLYTSLALITYCFEWDLPLAERYARRSIELNPQNWYAHAMRGEILGTAGRVEEGLEEAQNTLELDPLSSMAHAFYAIMLGAMNRVEEGRERMLKAIAMESNQPMLHYWMGMSQLMEPISTGKAIEHLKRAFELGVTPACGYLGAAYALAGRRAEALECLGKLATMERQRFLPLPLKLFLYLRPALSYFRSFKKKYVPAYLRGVIYAALDMHSEALAEIEKSVQSRDYLLPAFFTLTDLYPWMAATRDTPRFKAIRAKVKIA